MTLALKEIQIRGEIHSNVDYTVDLLNVRNINHLLNHIFIMLIHIIKFDFLLWLNLWCYFPIIPGFRL
jgi:hypothetical protein